MTEDDNIASARSLIRILKLAGLWPRHHEIGAPYKCSPLRIVHHFYRYMLHLPLTFTYIALMWTEAFTSQDLEQVGNVLYISFTEAALVVKILTIWSMDASAARFMAEVAHSNRYVLHTTAERELWRREQYAFGRIAFYYIGGSLAALGMASVGVLFLSDFELPFAYWTPFDWRNADYFWYAYGYEMLAMSLTCISNITLDMMFCYFLFHVGLLYKVLGMRLSALQHMREENALRELLGIFQLHQNVRRLTLQCQSLVSTPILAQIILSAFILCFSGYRLQNMRIAENLGKFFATIQFVAVMILQIFLPCYYANGITVNCEVLTTSVYSSDWLQFSVPTRKLVVLYMEFLKRPVTIKAGAFFIVGLPIFSKTINNAYSFFAVLLNMEN